MLPGGVIEGVPHILGRYKLLHRKLGTGNYATVVEAIHLDLEVHVAIKMIDTSKIRDQYVLRHLAREAAVLRRLAHPNIIAVFESMRAGPLYCLVTELVAGGELSAYVSRKPNGHLDETETMRFAGQLLSALAHMHHRGVVHRDLKMRNILLNRTQDAIKVVDFGLSNVWSPGCPLRTHCGSPGYAAPEIYIVGKTYGPEVDMWSLGVVLFGMAVGLLPFPTCKDKTVSQQERRKRMIAQISRGATESHLRAMDHFSPLFRDLVSRLLKAAPAQRLTIKEATNHPWLTSRPASSRLYRLSARESGFIFSQLAIMLNMPVGAIEEQCRTNRLSEVGAAYNILAYQQLNTYHVAWGGRTSVDSEEPPRSTSEYDQAFGGKSDVCRNQSPPHSSINDVLQSGIDTYQYVERESTPLDSLKTKQKNAISRLTVEPISITVVEPSWTVNSHESVAPLEQPNFHQSPTIRSPLNCFSKSVESDNDASLPQERRNLLKKPKSFSTLSTQESLARNKVHSQISKSKPVTSVATTTKETKHCSVQTDSDVDITQEIVNICSLQDIQQRVGHINILVDKSTMCDDHLDGFVLRDKKSEVIEPASSSTHALMQSFTKKTKSFLSSKMNGNFFTTRTKSKISTAGSKPTLMQSALNESSSSGTLCGNGRNQVDRLQTPKLITGNSQSKILLKSACPSRHNTGSTEIIENKKSNQTDDNKKLKKRRGDNSSRKINPVTHFRMDVALQKTFVKANHVPPIPLNVWACNKRGSISKTKSKTSCQQLQIPTPMLHKEQKNVKSRH